MEINDLNTLVDYIFYKNDKEEAAKLILQYGHKREQHGIEHEFNRCLNLFKISKNMRHRDLRNFIMDYEEDNRTISVWSFNRFFWSVYDYAAHVAGNKDASVDIQDFMFDKLGDIKVDRRLTFLKED